MVPSSHERRYDVSTCFSIVFELKPMKSEFLKSRIIPLEKEWNPSALILIYFLIHYLCTTHVSTFTTGKKVRGRKFTQTTHTTSFHIKTETKPEKLYKQTKGNCLLLSGKVIFTSGGEGRPYKIISSYKHSWHIKMQLCSHFTHTFSIHVPLHIKN